jgi:hypothetical protein
VGDGLFAGAGVADGTLGAGDGLFDGAGRLAGLGEASGFDSCVVASAAVMGRARGGS